ncbi:MAG: aspartate aminotransferase family protein [Dehalococcoidia bacterium]
MIRKSGINKSNEYYKKASDLIPGKTQLISRRASQFASGVSPVYAKSAKGSKFIDVDGNEYIDWVNAVSAVILGHADNVVDTAVKEQIDKGSIYTLNSPMEIELAELLVDTIPSAQMVRYSKGGGDACTVAIRIARGVTGKDKVLFSGYHGWHDWYQSANYLVDPESGEFPFAGIEPIGVPKVLAGTALPFIYGDLNNLEQLLNENKGEVAAIMMEPLRSDLPEQGYLEGVQKLAKANDVILIFDEVSCGWRTRIGGIQEFLNVTPDMSVFAKAMSNGYPMGVTVGSRDVMEPASEMFISSSYWSDNVGLAASITTINELKSRNSEDQFENLGARMRKTIDEVISSVGIPAKSSGFHYRASLSIDLPDETLRPKINTLFIQEMASNGVYSNMGFMPTLSHTEEDIKKTAEAIEASLKVVQKALEGDLDKLLIAEVKKEPFRRLVR